ncbi:hypothetical protein NECAME_03216 [Necator americanus]|uniref:Uncharacterized protein n=1 Tax=Necator americanus TaxID=51031 RepID=W2T831_NECAM|nr:hypothetical protein NECAME_03216 [Necator americanus]ETN77316.1 hypothetical protein NECAME_03216 [Necator americanus]
MQLAVPQENIDKAERSGAPPHGDRYAVGCVFIVVTIGAQYSRRTVRFFFFPFIHPHPTVHPIGCCAFSTSRHVSKQLIACISSCNPEDADATQNRCGTDRHPSRSRFDFSPNTFEKHFSDANFSQETIN